MKNSASRRSRATNRTPPASCTTRSKPRKGSTATSSTRSDGRGTRKRESRCAIDRIARARPPIAPLSSIARDDSPFPFRGGVQFVDRSARSPPPRHPARDVHPSGHRIERARGGRARGRRPRPRRHPPFRQARSVPPRPRGRGVDAQVRSIMFTPVHARPRPSAGALSVALSRPMKRPCHQIPNQSHHLPPRRPPIERPAATRRRPTRARFSTR